MSAPSVLIVDDERGLARAIKLFLQEHGYEAEVAESGEKALELLDRFRPDVVFVDVSLPGMNGLELLRRVRALDPGVAAVVMTAYGTVEDAVRAMKLGAFDYVKKPVDLEELRLLADRAREDVRLKSELSYYRSRGPRGLSLQQIVTKSPAMRDVLARVRQVAGLDETPPVLITGETGTGKGLIARTLHAHSARHDRAFIEVNCTSLPATLMEAEVFGYERGAFTDARESKVGLFEAADGGFIFLDEVGDLEPPLQGKLLRAIEDRVVRRIGGVRDRTVDVRVLAATHRDLAADVEAGAFRKDLYFRLAVILLHLPPLRERGEDVLLLANHFLQRSNAKYGKSVRGISDSAARALREYPWPGNVRELAHVMERAVLWSRGPDLEIEELSPRIEAAEERGPAPRADPATRRRSTVAGGEAAEPSAALGSAALLPRGVDLATWERAAIERALTEAGGNQSRAARRLGVSRDTLRYRMKKFGLETR